MAEAARVPGARLALASLQRAPRERLHLLPCSVRHDGAAAVGRYFEPAIRSPESPEETSVSFRGRSLKGKQTFVPEGYVGLVLEDEEASFPGSEERRLGVKSTFKSLTVWNLEQVPSATDEILMALHWPKIAEGIHAPVPEEA